jgi:DNA-binding response OmpR family regulator
MKDKMKRILIIDPDSRAKEETRVLLASDDCEVDTCCGITDGVEKIKDVYFDCIIMDVHLPEMKGYEAVHILKTIHPKTYIIVTTAENTRELEIRVREQDIFYYYIKSFDREELRAAVHNVFEKIGKVKEECTMNQPAKILIVDDDPDYARATRVILESKNYKVEVAHNRNEAFDKIKEVKPDLILLDIMMDRLDDGFTICYKLKHDATLKHIPVFSISSITEKTGFKFNPKTDGEYFEADDYAQKPIEAKELLRRVDALLQKK